MLRKKCKVGRKMEEICVGEKLVITEKVEDRDLLLYLGLTDDSNPLYIQHDYASQTPYQKPIVPSVMLTGMIVTAVTKYLPGPGSHIVKQELHFPRHVHHYTTLSIHFEVVAVHHDDHTIEMRVVAYNEKQQEVIEGTLTVAPPYVLTSILANALDNF